MNVDATKSASPTAPAAPAVKVVEPDAQAEVNAAQQAAAVKRQAEQAVSDNAVKAAAQQIDSYLKSTGRNLDFRVDQDTGRTVVTVRDSNTGDVIRQIPSEEALKLARSLGESNAAILDMMI